MPNWQGHYEADFVLAQPEPLRGQSLLRPRFSLYNLDFAAREAVFVETPAGIDLNQAAFYSEAQFKSATSLITLPFAEFIDMAAEIPAPESLILLYNMGRCGSTLLHHVFNRLPGFRSYSEPDFHQTLQIQRPPDGSNDASLELILRAATLFLAKPPGDGGQTAILIKLRPSTIFIEPFIRRVFPDSKKVFLYRNAEPWAISMSRAFNLGFTPETFTDGKTPAQNLALFSRLIPGAFSKLTGLPRSKRNLMTTCAAIWLRMLEEYEALARQEPFFAMRYEELTAHPSDALVALFEACCVNPSFVEHCVGAFARDSQEGTIVSRDSQEGAPPPDAEEMTSFIELIKAQEIINRPDYEVSQLWRPDPR